MFNMSRDAMLCLTITKTLKEALYKKAENKRMKIGDIIDLILFESVNTYQNRHVTFETSQRFLADENKEIFNVRCEKVLKDKLKEFSKRDNGGDSSVTFQMIASNFLAEK